MGIPGIDGVRACPELPKQTDLLPNEVAVRIGCEACSSALAGSAVIVTRSKTARDDIRRALSDFSEVTEVPSVVEISGIRREFAAPTEDCAVCPMVDQLSYVEEVMTTIGLDRAQIV